MLKSTPGLRSRNVLPSRLLASFCSGSLILTATCAQAGPKEMHAVYDYNIPRTTRALVIKAFSQQSNDLLISYLASDANEDGLEDAEEVNALIGPVQGQHSFESVLLKVLDRSALTFRWFELDGKESLAIEPMYLADIGFDLAVDEPLYWIGDMTVLGDEILAVPLNVDPIVTFNREFIDQSGVPTMGELLREVTQQLIQRRQTSGAENLDLHGLGIQHSQVLVNGRRVWPSAGSLSSDAFDLRSIPVAAIQSVEVLPPSGSAAYGIDVVGGAMNLILRREVAAPTVEAFHRETAGGGDQDQVIAFASSQGFSSNGMLTFEYIRNQNLLGSDRSRWNDQDYRRFGSRDYRSLNTTPNISSWSGEPLPGFDSTYAAVSANDGSLLGGARNLDSLYRYHSIAPEETRVHAVALGEIALSADTLLRGELLHATHDSTEQFAPAPISGLVVPADNPDNSFAVPIVVNAGLLGLGPQRQKISSDQTRAAAVLMGPLRDLYWELSLTQFYEFARTELENSPDLERIAQALNVFVPNPGHDASMELLADGDVQHQRSRGSEVAAVVSGPLLTMPAGKVSLMLGGSQRMERMEFSAPVGQVKRNIFSSFAEMNLPLLRAVSARLALRSDDYSDAGRFTRPQFGLTWEPYPALRMQAVYGKTARPASLYERFAPDVAGPAQASDPRRGNEPASFVIYRGGAADLEPTTGESFNAHVEFNLTEATSLTLNYWQVSLQHRSTLLSLQPALAQEDLHDRIQRDAPTPADVAAGRAGPIRSVDLSRVDLGDLDANGVDLSFSRTFDTQFGRFTPRLDATWVREFETMESGTLSDRAGAASEYGSTPDWKGRLSMSWERGALTARAVVSHTPAYEDAIAGVPLGTAISAITVLDLYAVVDLGRMGWQQMRIGAGVTDVFDRMAPYAQVGGVRGFDDGHSRLQGREGYLRISRQF